jgi:uncharacterized protein (TIGR03083 family)
VQPDYQALMISESRDLASLLETLSVEQWDAQSLCAGWRVKDVIAHMAVGHTMPMLGFGAAVARHRFRISAAAYALATSYADAHPAEEILARFREGTAGRPRAAARFVPIRELFTDHLVHHQDIRRPLGLSRTIPPDRLHAALTALPRLSGRVGSRRRMSGLRVVATDLDFELGPRGPELHGPAEALIMALTGRAATLGELSGSAVPTLARRLPAMRTRTGRQPASATRRYP